MKYRRHTTFTPPQCHDSRHSIRHVMNASKLWAPAYSAFLHLSAQRSQLCQASSFAFLWQFQIPARLHRRRSRLRKEESYEPANQPIGSCLQAPDAKGTPSSQLALIVASSFGEERARQLAILPCHRGARRRRQGVRKLVFALAKRNSLMA